MRLLSVALLACLLRAGPCANAQNESPAASATPTATPITGDPAIYGQYPVAYRELIERWLGTKLVDAKSAVIDWGDPPKPGEYQTQKGEKFVGYVVDFKVNSRNQFGTYTGKQKYRVVIKNGEFLWGGHPRY